jgi:hypothetical protein
MVFIFVLFLMIDIFVSSLSSETLGGAQNWPLLLKLSAILPLNAQIAAPVPKGNTHQLILSMIGKASSQLRCIPLLKGMASRGQAINHKT